MRRTTPILFLLLTLTWGCSSGETSEQAAAAAPTPASLCDAAAAIFGLAEDATGAEAEAVVDALVAHAPPEVAGDVATLLDLGATADGLGAYTDRDYIAADAAVTQAVLDDCDQDALRVGADDYAFAGLPSDVDTGRVVVELTNTSDVELHELSLLRKNDDVEASFDELFELPDDEATAMVSPYGTTIVGPGATTVLVTDLPPGEYLAVCFLPVGSLDGGLDEPHAAHGMYQTFTVSS